MKSRYVSMYRTDLYNQNVEIYIYISRLLQNCPGQFILSSVKEIFYVSWTSSAIAVLIYISHGTSPRGSWAQSTPNFYQINFNIIFSYMPRSPKLYLPVRLFSQNWGHSSCVGVLYVLRVSPHLIMFVILEIQTIMDFGYVIIFRPLLLHINRSEFCLC